MAQLVVCGPFESGPIKKEKKEIVKKINKTTKPTIERDNHSPVFNISLFLVKKVDYFNFVKLFPLIVPILF